MRQVEERPDVILGVDTHFDTHVGVVIDALGCVQGTLSVAANPGGYTALLKWAQSFGVLRRAGVEGTGSYGAGLTRLLEQNGVSVIEVTRPDRSRRRRRGKSDPTDAESAARAVLSGDATGLPKAGNGLAEALRIVTVARRSAVKAKTQAINQVRALLVNAPAAIRGMALKAKPEHCIAACASLPTTETNPARAALLATLRLLAKRWETLNAELRELDGERPAVPS
jgi:transposase